MAAQENSPMGASPDAAAPPLHVAIVMDGNGRWAQRRGLPRTLGHRAGVEALKRIVEAAPTMNIRWLTVFGFSTENWNRPAAEVAELMALPRRYFESDLARLEREGVCVRVIGARSGLSPDLIKICDQAQARTAHNDRFFLNVAFNYGGKADILQAASQFAAEVAAGRAGPDDLTEAHFASLLATAASPPPDMIVRPSGEQRLSNFMLWQAAYAELIFQDVLWPDYSADHLRAAIAEFQTRNRRYGTVAADDTLAAS